MKKPKSLPSKAAIEIAAKTWKVSWINTSS